MGSAYGGQGEGPAPFAERSCAWPLEPE